MFHMEGLFIFVRSHGRIVVWVLLGIFQNLRDFRLPSRGGCNFLPTFKDRWTETGKETSVKIYHYSLRNNPEDFRSLFYEVCRHIIRIFVEIGQE